LICLSFPLLTIAGGSRPLSEPEPAEDSQARGRRGKPRAASPLYDRSQRELLPNLIGSDTSCRRPVSSMAGVAADEGELFFKESHIHRFAPLNLTFARPNVRAALRTSPRRDTRSAAPEVPSIRRPTPEGACSGRHRPSVTRMRPSTEPAPFHSPNDRAP
jgi:hypothetical protein